MKNLFSLLLVVVIGTGTATFSQTVTIGTQEWMTKNLNVSTFRNGDPIPEVKTDEEWKRAAEEGKPAWCYYDNDPANGAKYGKLYNWYAVNDSRGLAPVGYHIPSDEEWTKLTDFLGGEGVAGTKMKSKSGWNSYRTGGGTKYCPNCRDWSIEYRSKVPCHTCKDTRRVPEPEVTKSGNGTNSSGFFGLPGGFRNGFNFQDIDNNGSWWSTKEHYWSYEKEYLKFYAWHYGLDYNNGYVEFTTAPIYHGLDERDFGVKRDNVGDQYKRKECGLSVRCLKGEIPRVSEIEEIPQVSEIDPNIYSGEVPSFVEEEADYPGGFGEMGKFINDNIDYPQEAIDSAIRGRVTVRFIVEKTGQVSNVSVAIPLAGCKACDRAAVKVVEKMPAWIPGKNGGKAVRSWVTLPIAFQVAN